MSQELLQHNKIPAGHIHSLTNWRFATSAERLGTNDNPIVFKAADLDKMCYDEETNKYYLLKSINISSGAPTWYLLADIFSSTGESNTTASLGDGAVITAGKTGTVLNFKSLKAGTAITFEVDGDTITINGQDYSASFAPISHVGAGGSAHSNATTTVAGFMSAADKIKLDGLVSNAVHTGDVLGGTALTIAAHAVTFAKFVAATTDSILIGRAAGTGSGDFGQIVLGDSLAMSGNILNVANSTTSANILALEDLAQGDLVNIFNSAGTTKVRKASATSSDTECHGYVKSIVNAGSLAEVDLSGINPFVSGLIAGNVFLSDTPGLCTNTAPTGSGHIQQSVGIALSASSISFHPQPSIELA